MSGEVRQLSGATRPIDDGAARPEGRWQIASLSRFWSVTLLIAAGALLLRVAYVALLSHRALSGDGLWYHLQAQDNANGVWFLNPFNGQPTALHPPAWDLVITALARFGLDTLVQQQFAVCLIGTTTVVVMAAVGRRVAGDRAGWIAAGIAAVWPGMLFARSLLSESLLLLLVACVALAAYRVRDRASPDRVVVLGVAIGLLLLTRSEEALVVALVAMPVIVAGSRAQGSSATRTAALTFVGVAVAGLLVSPWMLYNQGRFSRDVLLSNGLGNLVGGSYCHSSFYGPLTGAEDNGCVYIRLAAHPGIDESQQDHVLRTDAINYAEKNLGRLPMVLVAREGRAFGFYSPLQEAHREATWGNAPLAKVELALVGFWLLVIPSVVGGWILRRRGVPIYPLAAFVVVVAVSVAATQGSFRYRAAANVPIALFAAVAIDVALTRWWRRAPLLAAA